MIKEITVFDPITWEEQPDGGRTPILDPYDGCQIGCPYCFQWSNQDWNKDILVKTNLLELLRDRLSSWDKTQTIYLGSRCDPYMQAEEHYRLTRDCLELLSTYNINTMITTKSDNRLILRDVELLQDFKAEMTVLMGISNINQISKGIKNGNILTANQLHQYGIRVWAFLTPVLPYLMDVPELIDALDTEIPVFLDLLRIGKDTIQEQQLMQFISHHSPELTEQYQKIIREEDTTYYDQLVERYAQDKRVTILFQQQQ